MIYLTCFLAEQILKKKKRISPDLGITFTSPVYENDKVIINKGEIPFDIIEYVAKKKRYSVFIYEQNKLKPIQLFSDKTNLFYKLVSYKPNTAPTIQISGTHMHRVVGIDPWGDARNKINLIAPRKNDLGLDSCTGLGYTAILAARKCKKVITVEKDENVIQIAKLNPWSKELFTADNIRLIIDDIQHAIVKFKDSAFDFIIHDPPQYYHAKELYSRTLYAEFYRVLKKEGRFFHYVGKVGTRLGKKYIEQIKKRLLDCRFRCKWNEKSLGFICFK
ncbi:methyltransferase domain-containing protein [Candidatus Woesearchaeota archaeon]|nr:methyltransferase domain-containing protein [Candidatus Woesearchaeota archaeon]